MVRLKKNDHKRNVDFSNFICLFSFARANYVFFKFFTFLTKLKKSFATSSGCSNAAKCPPSGMEVNWTMFLYLYPRKALGEVNSSWGKAAIPVGTVTGTLQDKSIEQLIKDYTKNEPRPMYLSYG